MPISLHRCLNRIVCGDAFHILKQLPSDSIDCVVTSPPYWALRDYGVTEQLGLEPTLQDYLERLCSVFDEVKRVLKPAGTCWINLGDTYSTRNSRTGRWSPYLQSKHSQATSHASSTRPGTHLPKKYLLQVPARFAIMMIDRGWILRNEIIWHKPTAMPDGAKDRFTVDFEKIFFFVKQPHYWFDLDAVREPHRESNRRAALKQARKMGYDGGTSYKDWYFQQQQKLDWVGGKHSLQMGKLAARGLQKTKLVHPLGRAKRCVWSIATRPFFENHYATYPPDLIKAPITAGCPKGGIVLDPFIGSGTTAVVARQLGRQFIGIDLNPQYVRLAKNRLLKEQS